MTAHLEQTVQRDVDRIRSKIAAMAALSERALKDAAAALGQRNRQLAYSIILRDQRVDELEKEVDRLCLEFIVRQQPVAGLLRFAYATIKVNSEVERVGDYAESMARQILVITSVEKVEFPQQRFEQMVGLAISMFRDAVDAFVRQDAELARKTVVSEGAIDVLRHELNEELVKLREQGRIALEALNPLMTIVNRFERVGDQAKNICRETLYMCTGEYQKHRGSDVYRVLFVDEHNSCRSKLAEAIGQSLGKSGFIFTSAGLDPKAMVDPAGLFFMKQKGIDMSRHKPRAVSEVPNLEHYQIIVALAESARTVFPPAPTKAVCLDWSMKDPSTVYGTADEINAAYEETYRFLEAHVKDLVEAILGDTD
jgi:phosphate transport system protein